MERVDCLIAAARVCALTGTGPWLIGPGRADVPIPELDRRVMVTRKGDGVELTDLDGQPIVVRGLRRPRHSLLVGDAAMIGRSPVLAATLVDPGSARWHRMIAAAGGSFAQLEEIARAGASRAPVLLAGESGTGKELAARALHSVGERRGRAFVALNCAALPDTLAESELFGVERGAYTGATRTRAGAFVEADGGTLFLDEVGELSPAVQAKLLRALESGEVQPVGCTRTVKVDVRIIAASWRDLEAEAEAARFRHDLLHRLCVLRVDLLPLRDRRDDILPIVRALLRERESLALAPDPWLAARLRDAPWRGNVRELRNCVDRAVAACDPRELLPRQRAAPPREPGTRREAKLHQELSATIAHYRGNRKLAASAMGVSRSTLYRWLGACERAAGARGAGFVDSAGDGLTPMPARL